jgi:hypothetical protein
VSNRSLGLFQERTQVQLQRVRRHKSFVTWMMDLGRISLDGHDSGKWDACLGRIAWFLYSGSHRHMIGAHDLFESFTESDSGMYVELGMGTRHAVQGSGTMLFQMELGDVLRVTNVLWVPECALQSQRLRRRDMQFCSGWTGVVHAQRIYLRHNSGSWS